MNSPDLSFFDTQEIFTYKKLNLDLMLCSLDVVKEFYPHKPNFTRFAHYKIPNNRLDKNFLNILTKAGMTPKHAEIFYRPGIGELMDAFIHTDGHQVIPGFAKINFILGGTGNIMKWWRPKTVTEKNNMFTPIGTKYLKFSSDECILLEQTEMLGLYVINAGIPHSVEMRKGSPDVPRICISVTPLLTDINKNVGCADAYNRLNNILSQT